MAKRQALETAVLCAWHTKVHLPMSIQLPTDMIAVLTVQANVHAVAVSLLMSECRSHAAQG